MILEEMPKLVNTFRSMNEQKKTDVLKMDLQLYLRTCRYPLLRTV